MTISQSLRLDEAATATGRRRRLLRLTLCRGSLKKRKCAGHHGQGHRGQARVRRRPLWKPLVKGEEMTCWNVLETLTADPTALINALRVT